eukprot:TRINITY_DN2427_c0_g1_i1.p1 TRINITY_DN2427_c0_g1~~TRINITY_DN2427_c0_g1_i1.p1  ORF type:complete len:848 (-),score=43.11 TRINITY_DN2427_c0_g1_i1:10375-12918(-)
MQSEEKANLSLFAPEQFDDIELIMHYEKFVLLLFNVHLMKSQLESLIFPKYGSKDKKTITSDIFVHIVKDLHEIWEGNIPCDAAKVLKLHQTVSPSLNPVLNLEECAKFFTDFVLAQYQTLKDELVKRKLLIGSFVVTKFITRYTHTLKEMLQTCETHLKDMPKFMETFEPYFVEEGKADKFAFRDALRTLSNHLSCQNTDRPDIIFNEVFSSIDKDADGKVSKEEFMEYAKGVIIGIKDKLIEIIPKSQLYFSSLLCVNIQLKYKKTIMIMSMYTILLIALLFSAGLNKRSKVGAENLRLLTGTGGLWKASSLFPKPLAEQLCQYFIKGDSPCVLSTERIALVKRGGYIAKSEVKDFCSVDNWVFYMSDKIVKGWKLSYEVGRLRLNSVWEIFDITDKGFEKFVVMQISKGKLLFLFRGRGYSYAVHSIKGTTGIKELEGPFINRKEINAEFAEGYLFIADGENRIIVYKFLHSESRFEKIGYLRIEANCKSLVTIKGNDNGSVSLFLLDFDGRVLNVLFYTATKSFSGPRIILELSRSTNMLSKVNERLMVILINETDGRSKYITLSLNGEKLEYENIKTINTFMSLTSTYKEYTLHHNTRNEIVLCHALEDCIVLPVFSSNHATTISQTRFHTIKDAFKTFIVTLSGRDLEFYDVAVTEATFKCPPTLPPSEYAFQVLGSTWNLLSDSKSRFMEYYTIDISLSITEGDSHLTTKEILCRIWIILILSMFIAVAVLYVVNKRNRNRKTYQLKYNHINDNDLQLLFLQLQIEIFLVFFFVHDSISSTDLLAPFPEPIIVYLGSTFNKWQKQAQRLFRQYVLQEFLEPSCASSLATATCVNRLGILA